MRDILVSEDIAGPALDDLRTRYEVVVEPALWRDEAALAERIAGCRALLVRNQTQVTPELLRHADRLEVVGRAGAGLDNIDGNATAEAGLVVCYAPDQNALSVAELGMGMLLALSRELVPAVQSTRSGAWDRRAFTGTELFGSTLGIIGFGRIGFLIAMRARAFGMRILAHDPFIGPDAVTVVESGATLVTLEELLAESDVVSCHLPSTPKTRGFLGADRFRLMKPTALFLNLSRGEVVDEPALVEALREGRIRGAALDVRATEPPEPSALEKMENVLLTPHIAAFTEQAQDRVLSAVCRDLAAVLEGRPPLHPAPFSVSSGKRA